MVQGDDSVTRQDDIAADHHRLHGAAAIAVRREHDAADRLQGTGEIIDDQGPEAGLINNIGWLRRRGISDGQRHLRRGDLGIPDGRQGRDAVQGEIIDPRESMRPRAGTVVAEGDIIREGVGCRGSQARARGHGETTDANGAAGHRTCGGRAVIAEN